MSYTKFDAPYRWVFAWEDYRKNPMRYIPQTVELCVKNISYFFKWLKWCLQRGFRGWADCDWWSMDYYLIDIIIPMLKTLRDNQMGHPCDLTEEQWVEKLNEMIEGFEAGKRVLDDEYYEIVSPDFPEKDATRKEVLEWGRMNMADQKIFKQKMKIFIKYFFNLWD